MLGRSAVVKYLLLAFKAVLWPRRLVADLPLEDPGSVSGQFLRD